MNQILVQQHKGMPAMTPLDIVKQFYAKLSQGDMPGLNGLLTTEIAWTEARRFPYYGGTWTRPQQVLENLIMPLGRDWDGFSVNAEAFIVEGDEVVAFGAYRGAYKTTGKSIDVPLAHRWRVENGRLVSFVQYTDTALILAAME
jgi:ketosteroid isomerase-like protein